jgi:hypothetical protein
MPMVVYDVDGEVAFALLRWLPQERNVKLGLPAQQIRADLRAVAAGAIVDRAAFDHLLIAAHRNVAKGRWIWLGVNALGSRLHDYRGPCMTTEN